MKTIDLKGVILVVPDNELLPGRCDKQPSFSTGIADDIHLPITGEVGRHRNIVMQPLPDDVTFPIALCRSFNAGQDESLNEQNPQNAHDVIDYLSEFDRIGMIVDQRNRLCTNHNDRARFLKCFFTQKARQNGGPALTLCNQIGLRKQRHNAGTPPEARLRLLLVGNISFLGDSVMMVNLGPHSKTASLKSSL